MTVGNLVACPHCGSQLVNDGTLAGRVVACPHCTGQFQMPGQVPTPHGFAPSSPVVTPSNPFDFNIQTSSTHRPRSRSARQQSKTTDIFALLCLMSGALSIFLIPIILMPICYICGFVSYYRLKEKPNLKGQGLRVTGWIFGSISLLYLLWIFRIGPFAGL